MCPDVIEESKQVGIRQSFIHQNFLMRNSPKFSSAKHLHCAVSLHQIGEFTKVP